MCEHFGYEVRQLRRERFVNIQLGKLELGYWRNLEAQELEQLLG
jgi:23S rRNA pseudouridine2604 synthase